MRHFCGDDDLHDILQYIHECQILPKYIENDTISFEGLITTEAFRDIVISLGSTYCLYLISSIIYLQPWHMLTSFIQYILLSPSYINVLNIYAFCNVHDLSWGTKGAMANPLGKINTTEDGTFKMEVLVSSSEIQANYDKYLKVLNDFDPKSESRPTEPSYDEKRLAIMQTLDLS